MSLKDANLVEEPGALKQKYWVTLQAIQSKVPVSFSDQLVKPVSGRKSNLLLYPSINEEEAPGLDANGYNSLF